MKNKKELLLIDGRNFCYRHFHTRKELTSRGRPTGAIFGTLSALIRLHRFFPDASIVFCWDGRGSKQSWRHKLNPDYKANRKRKPGEPIPKEVTDIRIQIAIIEKLIDRLGFRNFSVPKFEADDLIGVLATALKKQFHKIIIYSSDKDYFQLVKDNVVVVRDTDKKLNCREITAKEMKKHYKVGPKQWLHFRSLTGDHSDNIKKPIAGIGEVKALQLLAAGLDPSKKKPFKNENFNFKKEWPAVRIAYKLSKIVRVYNDSRVPEVAQKALKKILQEVKGSRLERTKEGRSKKTYNYLLKFLAEYHLADLMERREQLWRIP